MDDGNQHHKKHGCDDESSSKSKIENPERDGQSQQKQHSLNHLLQEHRGLGIDRKIELGIAFVALFVAIVLAGISINQLSTMKDQTAAMQAQLTEMKSGSADTKMLADAAAASTAAWIAVDRFTIKSIEKDQIIFDVVFKNIGKTPALDAKAGWEFTFINQSPPNDITDIPKRDPYQCPERMSVNLGILPPDKTLGTSLPTESGRMSIEEVQRIKNRTAKLIVHGCAKYRDILTDRERITEVGAYYPSAFDPADLAVGIHAPYSRMK